MFCSRPAGLPNIERKVLRCNLEISGSLFFFSKPFYSPIALLSMYIIYIYVEALWSDRISRSCLCGFPISFAKILSGVSSHNVSICAATNRLPLSSSMHDSATQKHDLCNEFGGNRDNKGKHIIWMWHDEKHVTLLDNLVTEFLVRQRGLAGNAEEETARTVFRSHLVYPQAPSGRYCHGMQRVSWKHWMHGGLSFSGELFIVLRC